MKTDASHHDYALDTMHADIELSAKQQNELDFLEDAIRRYKAFYASLDEIKPKFFEGVDLPELFDKIVGFDYDPAEYISEDL